MDDDDGDSGTENDDTPPDVDDEFKMDAYDEEGQQYDKPLSVGVFV